MGISIIIVNYNSSKYTINCIESLIKYENIPFEVIVVDNNSKSCEKHILQKYFSQHNNLDYELILSNKNNGFGIGNNIGVNKAKYEYILLLNTDTILKKPILKELIKQFKVDQTVGVIGIQLLNFDESFQASYGYFPSITQEIFELFPQKLKKKYENISHPLALNLNKDEFSRSVDYVSGAFMLWKKKLYLQVGGFSRDFFMYFEETDLCRRVIDLGYKIKIFNIKAVKHKGGGVIGAFTKQKALLFKRGKEIYLNKHSNLKILIIYLSKVNGFIKMIFYETILKKSKFSKEKALYWKFICLGK